MLKIKKSVLASALAAALAVAALGGTYAAGLLSTSPACAQGGCPNGQVLCCKKTASGATECRCEYKGLC